MKDVRIFEDKIIENCWWCQFSTTLYDKNNEPHLCSCNLNYFKGTRHWFYSEPKYGIHPNCQLEKIPDIDLSNLLKRET